MYNKKYLSFWKNEQAHSTHHVEIKQNVTKTAAAQIACKNIYHLAWIYLISISMVKDKIDINWIKQITFPLRYKLHSYLGINPVKNDTKFLDLFVKNDKRLKNSYIT